MHLLLQTIRKNQKQIYDFLFNPFPIFLMVLGLTGIVFILITGGEKSNFIDEETSNRILRTALWLYFAAGCLTIFSLHLSLSIPDVDFSHGPSHLPFLGILPILALFAFIQLKLYSNGYVFFSADDACRLVIAQKWARDPFLLTYDTIWLPGQFWLLGGAMYLVSDTLLIGKLLTLSFGIALIVVLIRLATQLYGKLSGFLTGLILVLWAPFEWLSGAPMAEIYTFLGMATSIYYAMKFYQEPSIGAGLGMVCAATFAATFRYEVWLYCLCLIPFGFLVWLKRNHTGFNRLWWMWFLPMAFPCLYFLLNWWITGNPKHFLEATQAVAPENWGTYSGRLTYLQNLFEGNFILLFPLILGIILVDLRCRKMIWLYLYLSCIPFCLWVFNFLFLKSPATINFPHRLIMFPILCCLPMFSFGLIWMWRNRKQLSVILLLSGWVGFNAVDLAVKGPIPHLSMDMEAVDIGFYLRDHRKNTKTDHVCLFLDRGNPTDYYTTMMITAMVGGWWEFLQRTHVEDREKAEQILQSPPPGCWYLTVNESPFDLPETEAVWTGKVYTLHRAVESP